MPENERYDTRRAYNDADDCVCAHHKSDFLLLDDPQFFSRAFCQILFKLGKIVENSE